MVKPRVVKIPLKMTPAQRSAQKFVLVKGQRVPIRKFLAIQKINASKSSGKGAVRP